MIGMSGIGIYLPDRSISIEELAPELSEQELELIGVKSILYEPNLTATEMATIASKKAIENAQLQATDIDLIINTQATLHDYLMWQVSAEIQNQLGAKNATFFDVYQGCSGFTAGLVIAKNFICARGAKTVLINSSEKWDCTVRTRRLGRMVYGECGVAVVLQEHSAGNHILGFSNICRGDFNDISRIPIGTIHAPEQQHSDSFYNFHVTNMEKSKQQMVPINIELFYQVGIQALEKSGLILDDIDFIIFPNVGFGLFEKVIDRYQFDISKTNYCYTSHTGDCGSADVILSYYRMLISNKIKKNDNVLILSQGAGFTWAAIIIRV